MKLPEVTHGKLFTQVIAGAVPEIQKLWQDGDRFLQKHLNCPQEIVLSPKVGRSYYKCQPHLWQCFWQGGLGDDPHLKIDLFGQTYHLVALSSFPAIREYSEIPRSYQMVRHDGSGVNLKYGYVVELGLREFPGQSQSVLLTDTCRDTFLPERIYGYGKVQEKRSEGFIWDNFGRKIFLDKFYVSNQQVNDWRVLTGQNKKIQSDRSRWAEPAYLSASEQRSYCAFFGKRVLDAKLFDAATMSPTDLKNPEPEFVYRPQTPWQRDLSKSFLGLARINPDYQLSPLDCQLAQVKGCKEKHYTTDSATWMGFNFALGFNAEALVNDIDPELNLKVSSRELVPSSPWHELGKLSHWSGSQGPDERIAFRCYEEAEP